VEIRNFGLQLWPGYVTSVRRHESDVLMCARVTTKVMRTETAYEVISNALRHSPENFKERVSDDLLGLDVLTPYNNRTYRVDDIRFDVNPLSEFVGKDGAISFVDYYKQVLNYLFIFLNILY
jgi:aubergine